MRSACSTSLARTVVAVLAAAILAGCATGRPLMPAPLVYAVQKLPPFGALSPELETSMIDVLYVTDRTPQPRGDGMLDYGINRSLSVAFGSAVVRIGGDNTWEDLARDASSGVRPQALDLTMSSVRELGRAPPTPLPFKMVDGKRMADPAALAEQRRVGESLVAHINERLARTPRKEVFLYIHGIQNTFSDAVFAMAELWHFFGREGVPIAYTWPAGHGGVLRGYTYDRESGEFTIYHLKQFLRALAEVPEVERVHVIAHSRGTDVMMTALRELFIETRARGDDPRRRFRIHNVVLAAPDMDLGVTLQRTAAEGVGTGADRVTIYTSDDDSALGAAMTLFGGLIRLGRLKPAELPTEIKDWAPAAPNLAIIEYKGKHSGAFGHDYFRTNASVASDLVLTIRYDRNPGAENGRPLRAAGGFFWEIHDGYPGAATQ